VAAQVKAHFKPKEPEKKVHIDPSSLAHAFFLPKPRKSSSSLNRSGKTPSSSMADSASSLSAPPTPPPREPYRRPPAPPASALPEEDENVLWDFSTDTHPDLSDHTMSDSIIGSTAASRAALLLDEEKTIPKASDDLWSWDGPGLSDEESEEAPSGDDDDEESEEEVSSRLHVRFSDDETSSDDGSDGSDDNGSDSDGEVMDICSANGLSCHISI